MTTSRTPGPLLTAWGPAASEDALARSLQPLGRALSVPVAGDHTAWDDADAATLGALRERAEAERGTPWPQPLASQYVRFFRDGDRTAYEERVATLQERLTRAVVLAAASARNPADRTTWIDEAADGIVLLCELSSWCWAAHEGTCRDRGTVVPDVDVPYLDLGAGEVAAQLAWADQVLGPLLDTRVPGLRDRVRHEVRVRVLEPFVRRRDWHWLGLDGDVHNWCPWICGNVLVTALALAEDATTRARAVAWAIEGIDRYLAALPPDGAIDEGYEYWWNGAARALEALETLSDATGGALDASLVPVIRETVRFPHRMHLGGDWYLNVADAQARPSRDQPWQVLHRWARRVGDHDAAQHAASYRAPGRPVASAWTGLGRLLRALTDPEWIDAEQSRPPLVGHVWWPGTQVALARETAGTATGLALAVKGGHNGEHHNHNDVGSVVVAVDGVPILVDAGRPTYTAQTFGPDRYSIWTMQSSWHNVPEVCGRSQEPGPAYRAREMTVVDTHESCRVRLDLNAAYPVPELETWLRTATLDRHARRVTVEDVWTLTTVPDHAPTTVHYLLAGHVESPAPGRVVVRPLDGARVALITWDPRRATGALTGRTLDDPMLSGVWGEALTRLDLQVPDDPQSSLTLTLEVLA
jgi:hypothetical protein